MSHLQPVIRVTLSPDVYAAPVDEHLVLLDVEADRYLCLPNGGDAVAVPGSRTLGLADNDLARTLLEEGLAKPFAGEILRCGRAFPPPPEASAILSRYRLPRPNLGDGLTALFDLARRYQGRSLADILASVADRPNRAAAEPTPELLAAVERFHTWIPYAPVSGKCLLRAFMLLRALNRQGLDADWVFGVATWPFRAHCWLQVGPVVLDDEVESVRPFAPIMVR